MSDWRARLITAADRDGRSDRAISLAAGLGPNFVNELRNSEKESSVRKVLALADTLGVSLLYVFSDIEASPEAEELLRVFAQMSPETRQALLLLARRPEASELA